MYASQITRLHPTAFIILIDQSGSMEEKIGIANRHIAKAEALASVTNMILSELIHRSRREEGIRDYFELSVIGYSGDGVESLISPAGKFTRPSLLVQYDVPTRSFTHEVKMPGGEVKLSTTSLKYWIEPKSVGNTPMFAALEEAYSLMRKWCAREANAASFPPIIFNITDGESTDCSDVALLEIAQKIKSLETSDGNVLLVNIHISSNESDPEIIFPSSVGELPMNKHAHLLYEASSIMPECFCRNICEIKSCSDYDKSFRGMSFNSSITDLLAMLSIGSMSVNMI